MITIDKILDIDNCEIQLYNGHTWEKDNVPGYSGNHEHWVDLDYPISDNIHYSDLSIDITKKDIIEDYLKDRDLFLIPKYMQYGDYDDSCMVERSNQKIFLEEYGEEEGIFTITGGYGSSGIAISLKWLLNRDNAEKAQSIIDLLNGLNDYPCIDDEDMSNMEYDAFIEALNDYGVKDALNEMAKKFNITVYDYNEEKLKDILLESDRHGNPSYIIESGGGCYIDIDQMIKPITLEMLKPVLTDYETNDLPVVV